LLVLDAPALFATGEAALVDLLLKGERSDTPSFLGALLAASLFSFFPFALVFFAASAFSF
jgi:hypothetical protein